MGRQFRTDDGKKYLPVDVIVRGETEKAILLSTGEQDYWVPKSVMLEWPETGDEGTALIAEWFCEKEGIA